MIEKCKLVVFNDQVGKRVLCWPNYPDRKWNGCRYDRSSVAAGQRFRDIADQVETVNARREAIYERPGRRRHEV
jgi:hypothetical protein